MAKSTKEVSEHLFEVHLDSRIMLRIVEPDLVESTMTDRQYRQATTFDPEVGISWIYHSKSCPCGQGKGFAPQ